MPLCVYDIEDDLPAGSLTVRKTGTPIDLGSSDDSPYSYGDYRSYRSTTLIDLAAADYAAVTEAQEAAAAIERSLYTSDSPRPSMRRFIR